MTVSREEIVTAALDLLDAQGLDGLTLRRLAGRLGISAPTLYWHIKDKRELLDLVAERIFVEHQASQPPITDIADPWERVAESFRRQYHAIISHRDAARVFAGNRPTEAMLPYVDKWLGLWVKNGFPPGEALTSVLSVGNYVIGAALEYEAEAAREQTQKRDLKALRAQIAPYPNLLRAAEARRRDPAGRHADFEHGLALMVAGLKARHAVLSGTKAAANQNENALVD